LTAFVLAATRLVFLGADLGFVTFRAARVGRRLDLALARAGRRLPFADLAADLAAGFRPLERPLARELFAAAFLVPRAALRLAITCSFLGSSTAAPYLDSFR